MLPTTYQSIIHLSRYSRWNDIEGRRENWFETVDRYISHFQRHLIDHGIDPNDECYNVARRGILNLHVMPSMRCLMTAGRALEREPLCGYNCTYRAIDDVHAFAEIMYALMCGCGVGFSVERQFTGKLPMIPRKLREVDVVIYVGDSREKWCAAYQHLLLALWDGEVPSWDVSRVRPAGARLKTMGGTASGPGPLVELFQFTVQTFKNAVNRRLSSLECHDLVCKIGDIVVVGGVRRSALISLSNLSDLRLRHAKSGDWPRVAPWRALSNNSVAYTEQPTVGAFFEEWVALYEGKSGERGFFSRVAATEKCRSIGRRTHWDDEGEDPIDLGTNPCGEIILRSAQTCNLTEAVVRNGDEYQQLADKIFLAAMLGTWQSTLTKFNFVGNKWRENCEEERLLGVSLTGIMDNSILNNVSLSSIGHLTQLRHVAQDANREWSGRLKIPMSAAITCVKPSGTVSQLVDASSGIHPRFAPHYLRRVTFDNHDPVLKLLVDTGFSVEPHAEKPQYMSVVAFPMSAPPGAICEGDRTPTQVLEHWEMFRNYWCDHNPSITVQLDEKDWPTAGAWVWEHFNQLGGVTFLPRVNSVYTQMPYEAISEERYEELMTKQPPEVNWSALVEYEPEDQTEPRYELACAGSTCEVV